MAKKIISIGFQVASDDVQFANFKDKTSLLDWDIILFRPNIDSFIEASSRYTGYDYFNGKITLDNTQSFRAKEACEHWRRELREAVDSGKTVLIHLGRPELVHAATGTTSTSGTGRNQKVTRHVAELSSYSSIPVSLEPTITQGSDMSLRQEYRAILASYWARFGAQSNYEVVFPKDTKGCCITTKHGSRPVSIQLSSKTSNGSILLLPDLDFEQDGFIEEVDDEFQYTKAAHEFAFSYIAEVVGLDKTLRETSEKTPAPDWANAESFALSAEVLLREELLQAEAELEKAQKAKERVSAQLVDAGQLRDLLYETGKPLEAAILKALRGIGFVASNYEDETSEFDAVFKSAEGRLLGEAEGKDNKSVAIGKLRQLSTNIHEDLEREDVDKPAKGILFGNAFRLKPPDERGECFTEKCKNSAVSMSIGLVATPELFHAARYLADNPDEAFAKTCRELLVQGSGVISFPEPPKTVAATKTKPENSE